MGFVDDSPRKRILIEHSSEGGTTLGRAKRQLLRSEEPRERRLKADAAQQLGRFEDALAQGRPNTDDDDCALARAALYAL